MSSVLKLVETGIFNSLTNIGELIQNVGYHPTDPQLVQVYNRQTKSGARYPFVLFELVSSVNPNNTPRRSYKMMYRIQVISDEAPTARDLYGLIVDNLDRGTMPLKQDWAVEHMLEREPYELLQNVEGNQYYRYGGVYEICLSKNF